MVGPWRHRRERWSGFAGLLLLVEMVLRPLPALATFNLDYVLTGRIWVPELIVDGEDLPRTDREAALLDFGCPAGDTDPEPASQPRKRDCHFERQVAEAIARSGVFRRVSEVDAPHAAADLVLRPQRTRVQFQRQVIPSVKPLLLLSLLTYVWTPLPYERDTETYHLKVAVLDRTGALQAEVVLDREHTHLLGTYSSEHTPPADLVAAIKPHEGTAGSITTCRGPHAGVVVHELLRQLADTVQRLDAPAP